MISIRYIKGVLFFHYIMVMWQKHIPYCYFLMQYVFQNHCPIGTHKSSIAIRKNPVLHDFHKSWVQKAYPLSFHNMQSTSKMTSYDVFNGYFPAWQQRTLRWRHNGRDSVSNHQPHDCLLNRLFRRRSKETSKLHVTGLCTGNSPRTGEFPAQMASYAENVSIWWRHHETWKFRLTDR